MEVSGQIGLFEQKHRMNHTNQLSEIFCRLCKNTQTYFKLRNSATELVRIKYHQQEGCGHISAHGYGRVVSSCTSGLDGMRCTQWCILRGTDVAG